MTIILPSNERVSVLCGRNNIESGTYRLSNFCMRVPNIDGELLYHNLTGELVLLHPGETVETECDELIRKWFLVSLDFDEYTFAKQVKQVLKLMLKKEKFLNSFMIFTTTACNARCSYCYELGRRSQNMSDKVAHDTADFIQKHYRGQEIRLRWFGGEPLYNRRAIDIITGDLRDKGVLFRSKMTTNAYLFDAEVVSAAVRDWRLGSLQITLDGTEQVYNRRKAFIYREGSPYLRVIRNISLLGAAGVDVSIRLNMDKNNFEDLMLLADELADRFGAERHVKVYAAPLRNFRQSARSNKEEAEQLCHYEQLRQKLKNLGIQKDNYLEKEIRLNRCMADSDQSITILPDGMVGKCEHKSEEKLIGSIYDENFDQDRIQEWKKTISVPECRSCLQLPTCIKLKDCDWNANGCTEMDRKFMQSILTDKILSTYQREKRRIESED